MEKYIKIILTLIVLLLIVWIGIHVWDLYQERRDFSYALEYNNVGMKEEVAKDSYQYTGKIELPREEYREGDILRYNLDFCKNIPDNAELVGILEDGTSYLYPTIVSDVDEGCYEFEEATYIIPRVGDDGGIPAGTYHLVKKAVYHPDGTTRAITFTVQTEEFEIVE